MDEIAWVIGALICTAFVVVVLMYKEGVFSKIGHPNSHIVKEIKLLNIEDKLSEPIVNYTLVYRDGTSKDCRSGVKALSRYDNAPIAAAECPGKIYCGVLRNDVRILFIITKADGSKQLVQTNEGTPACLKLLQMSNDPAPRKTNSVPVQSGNKTEYKPPYQLKKNELPQGNYVIGRDIPADTYDFFVVYGDGGKLDIGKYDEQDKIIDGTWNFYWVGLKEPYEKREVIHVLCPEGYTVKIRGNVILRIAKSQKPCVAL